MEKNIYKYLRTFSAVKSQQVCCIRLKLHEPSPIPWTYYMLLSQVLTNNPEAHWMLTSHLSWDHQVCQSRLLSCMLRVLGLFNHFCSRMKPHTSGHGLFYPK